MGVSLITGWLPWTVIVLGVAGGIFLLARRERWWWLYVVPGVVLASAVLAWILSHLVSESLFAQDLKTTDMVWIGVGIASIGLAVGQMFGTPWWRKLVAILSALCVVALAGNEINKSYDEYPRLGDLLGATGENVISGPPAVSPVVASDLNTTALTAIWTPTGANIPTDGGKISQITLPGTRSGFQGRDSWVYLPPAYFADNAQPLPVLILLHGQPGGGGDWVTGNRVQSAMNDFAAQHNGIAPVVVMPDVTGSPVANPLCTNSALGQLDTYLAVDVPNAIKSQLRVDPRPEHWGIGGFSYGGTCSMQMVTNHPDVFTSFLDVSGEAEPSLGSHQDTVQQAFGGDESKFKAINPIDIMAHEKFPQIAGWFYVGADDSDFLPGQRKMYQAAKDAGMDVQLVQVPGAGHDWALASTALAQTLPWFAQRMGIT